MEEKKSLLDVVKTVWQEHKGKVIAFVTALVSAVVGYFVG